jgi:hypothetical protein
MSIAWVKGEKRKKKNNKLLIVFFYFGKKKEIRKGKKVKKKETSTICFDWGSLSKYFRPTEANSKMKEQGRAEQVG